MFFAGDDLILFRAEAKVSLVFSLLPTPLVMDSKQLGCSHAVNFILQRFGLLFQKTIVRSLWVIMIPKH